MHRWVKLMAEIRPGRVDGDAAAMAAIFNHYVRTSTAIFSDTELSAEDMADKLRRFEAGVRYPFFVAETGDGVVGGYAYAHAYQPDAVYGRTLELTIYLAPEACGRGIGRQLLTATIEACRRIGAHVLIACVTAGNSPSERLFERAGFRQAGILPEVGFKFGTYHADALYYRILSE